MSVRNRDETRLSSIGVDQQRDHLRITRLRPVDAIDARRHRRRAGLCSRNADERKRKRRRRIVTHVTAAHSKSVSRTCLFEPEENCSRENVLLSSLPVILVQPIHRTTNCSQSCSLATTGGLPTTDLRRRSMYALRSTFGDRYIVPSARVRASYISSHAFASRSHINFARVQANRLREVDMM